MALDALFNLLLLCTTIFPPHVDAYRQRAPDTRRGVRWLEDGTSVLIRLETPDLPLWNSQGRIEKQASSSFIFNFTLQDQQVLLLNGRPIAPLKNALYPTTYNAPQTSIDLDQFEHGVLPNFSSLPSFELDYYRLNLPSEHPDSHYNIYDPLLTFDVVGAGIQGHKYLLADDKQRTIRVGLAELRPYQKYPYDKPISQRLYKIADVVLQDRFPYNPFFKPDELKECTIWSWICSDMDQYPWYHFVYRQAFDEYGKIGSLKHALLQRYHGLSRVLGARQATLVVVIMILAIFAMPAYGVVVMFRRMKCYFEPFGEQSRRYGVICQEEEEEIQSEDLESAEIAEDLIPINLKPLPPLLEGRAI